MLRYNATDDPDCYPGTQVLKNKAGLTDQEALDQFEQLMFLSRAEEDLPEGVIDYAHYCALHRHFFQDVYDWAGTIRTIRTGKGDNWFCYPEYIDGSMNRLFATLARESHLAQSGDLQTLAERAAYYVAEINAIHPFREGNGRCQMVFLNILLSENDMELDENRIDANRFMQAMIESFHGDNSALTVEILDFSTPPPKRG